MFFNENFLSSRKWLRRNFQELKFISFENSMNNYFYRSSFSKRNTVHLQQLLVFNIVLDWFLIKTLI